MLRVRKLVAMSNEYRNREIWMSASAVRRARRLTRDGAARQWLRAVIRLLHAFNA